MRIYVYEEGLARFATVPYQPPENKNLRNYFMHLTNYAINKMSAGYKQNETESGTGKDAHKRSLTQIYKELEALGYDVMKLKKEMDEIIIKTLISGQPSLWHNYRSCQPDDVEN